VHKALRITGPLEHEHGERLLRGVPVSSLDVALGRRPIPARPCSAERTVLPRLEGLATRWPFLARMGHSESLHVNKSGKGQRP